MFAKKLTILVRLINEQNAIGKPVCHEQVLSSIRHVAETYEVSRDEGLAVLLKHYHYIEPDIKQIDNELIALMSVQSLSAKEICLLAETSVHFAWMVASEDLWRTLLSRDYPDLPVDLKLIPDPRYVYAIVCCNITTFGAAIRAFHASQSHVPIQNAMVELAPDIAEVYSMLSDQDNTGQIFRYILEKSGVTSTVFNKSLHSSSLIISDMSTQIVIAVARTHPDEIDRLVRSLPNVDESVMEDILYSIPGWINVSKLPADGAAKLLAWYVTWSDSDDLEEYLDDLKSLGRGAHKGFEQSAERVKKGIMAELKRRK